ncbi:glycerophosphodiester phosphodiesterase [Paenibacillus pasadenensis]|uniref:glycerophosphodiester phosphodiesterase n=1 Tax=Paenibacillus pasadenensis TaxID=217090 RepID=UPI00203EDAED|nr:glycerophosphodiester phosphodiesterase [Paenibacillus pasadenensis]MCM3750264.1 glycerophosphodiester phosphodiesterase [Paenibacillus pasadenensis]
MVNKRHAAKTRAFKGTKVAVITLAAAVLLAYPARAEAAFQVEALAPEQAAPNGSVMRRSAVPIGPARPLVIAHRGASAAAPENTLAAFDQAVKTGADYIELDVQLSRDGIPFVLHDTGLERTTSGRGLASNRTMAELAKLDAGSWFSADFKNERIPTLEEVLRRYKGHAGLLIELKHPQLQPGLEHALAEVLTRCGMTGEERLEANTPAASWQRAPVIVQSFSLPALRRFNDLLPSIPLGVIISRAEEMEPERLHTMADLATYANIRKQLAEPKLVRRIHSSGMAVMVWTVDRRREAVKAVAAGADGIVTDDPYHFREWVKKPSSIQRRSTS